MVDPRTSSVVSAWLMAVAVAACSNVAAQPAGRVVPKVAISDLHWLAGTWVSTSGPTRFEERWTPPEGGAMLATSRTLRDDRMVGFEFLRIVSRGDAIVYIAQPGGRPPTEFPMTSSGPNVAVFENPTHDHPKLIRYRRAGTALTAEVEGVEQGKPVREVYAFTLVP